MLTEAAIGDAFGAGREYAPVADVAANNDGVTYVQHHKYPALTPGKYTDDTQMMIGLAEWMLSRQGQTSLNLAAHFLRAFRRDIRSGYAQRFYDILIKVKNAHELLFTIQPTSNRSGGAMRAAPCGLLPTVEEAIDLAMWQASLTHATRDGMGAAAGAAALTWACRHNCDRGYLPQFLEDVLPGFGWTEPWQGPVGAPGLHSVKAALASIVAHDNLNDILISSIAWTGDVDTVGCIAMAAASLHPGIEQNLRQELYDGLEPGGRYGQKYLDDLDAKLMAMYPPPALPDNVPEPGEVLQDIEEGPSTSLQGHILNLRARIQATKNADTESQALRERLEADLEKNLALCDHTLEDGTSALEGGMFGDGCEICGRKDT